VCILGFLRPEKNFSSLDDLIVAINEDISNAKQALDSNDSLKYKTDEFFSSNDNKTTNGSPSE
jgi:riboflavin kinase